MSRDFRKHTLNLREGDWDYLTSLLEPHSIPTAVFIRNLVSRQVDSLRSRESAADITLKVNMND